MNKALFLGAAALASFMATPASAAIKICTGSNCVNTDENVLITTQQSNVATVTGVTNQSNVGVNLTSPLGEMLNGDASGQAAITAVDGLLNALTFSLQPGYAFTSAVFNLQPLSGNASNEATSVEITYYTPGQGMQTQTVNTNGNNFIGVYGDAGEKFIAAGFVGNPSSTGIGTFKQLRLGGVAAVPEPGTWAMMLLGFGMLGMAMRRRKTAEGAVFA